MLELHERKERRLNKKTEEQPSEHTIVFGICSECREIRTLEYGTNEEGQKTATCRECGHIRIDSEDTLRGSRQPDAGCRPRLETEACEEAHQGEGGGETDASELEGQLHFFDLRKHDR